MTLQEALDIFQISIETYMTPSRSFKEAQRKFEKFKEAIKSKYKTLVKEHHPDINPDSDTEIIKKINAAKDLLLRIKIMPKPKPEPLFVRVSFSSFNMDATGGTTSSATGMGWYSMF